MTEKRSAVGGQRSAEQTEEEKKAALRESLINAYIRGFRNAVSGENKEMICQVTNYKPAYIRGYEAGARKMMRAYERAKAFARKVVE